MKRRLLSEELNRMKTLAGLVKESEHDVVAEGVVSPEEKMAAEEIADNIESVLSDEELMFLNQAYKSEGGKEMIAQTIDSAINESVNEELEPPAEGEFGMSQNEIKLRQIIDKIIKKGAILALPAALAAGIAGAPAVGLGLGIASALGFMAKDAAWWKAGGRYADHHHAAQDKYGVK